MKARDLIEAESPKEIFKKISKTPYPFTPRRLTPREIERLGNILAMGPLMKKPIDDRFLEWGYIDWYDNDEHDAVEAKPGFGKAFYSNPHIMGAVGDEWLDAPYQRRGRIRTWEGEDPKRFIRQKAPRFGPDDMFEVNSSHGQFLIYPDGRVAEWNAYEPDDYDAQSMARIAKFDLDEWKKYWGWEGELPKGFDILDLGYWLKDEMYEPADDNWREEIKRMSAEGGWGNLHGHGRVANPE